MKLKPLSQRDKRWANKLLGFNTDYKYTIGGYGCLITCQAILLDTTPDLVNEKLKAVKGFANGGYYVWGSLQKAYPQVVSEKVTNTPSPLTSTQVNEIKKAIDSGYFVMCGIDSMPNTQAYDQHYVLLKSYSGDSFRIIDPWTGTERALTDYTGIYAKTFKEAIYQYIIYQLKVETPVSTDFSELKDKLEALQNDLVEMRASRDKWKTKYEELNQESKKGLQAKIKHIEELQKTVAELNSQITLNTGSNEANLAEITLLREQLENSKRELVSIQALLDENTRENKRLADELINCQETEKKNAIEGGRTVMEALKKASLEMARVVVLAVIPVAIPMVERWELDWRILATVAIITLLRGIDKFLHESGKATNNDTLTRGLTRF